MYVCRLSALPAVLSPHLCAFTPANYPHYLPSLCVSLYFSLYFNCPIAIIYLNICFVTSSCAHVPAFPSLLPIVYTLCESCAPCQSARR